MTFQRARSEEQRAIRRRAILDTAAAMLDEMPVADVSLNELSRRVGLSAYVPPPAGVLAAYADEPALAVLHLDLRDALRLAFTSTLLGVQPRT